MKKSIFRVCSVLALCLLLLNPSLARDGAKKGLLLWSQAVLPNLLPFMICSNVIVALDAVHIIIFPVKRFLHRVLKLSDAGCYVLVSGLLCGYPMGAKTCSEFVDSGRIPLREGRYLLALCNHPSPMFLLGFAAPLLPKEIPVFLLLCSLYLPVLLLAVPAGKIYRVENPENNLPAPRIRAMSFDDSLMASCETMIKIGGYIMIFSILAAYISALPIQSPAWKAAFLGIVEITTGIQAISAAIPGVAGGLVIAAVTAFGGLSGIFQTKSVIKNAGLSIRHYVAWKIVHSMLAAGVYAGILLAARHLF